VPTCGKNDINIWQHQNIFTIGIETPFWKKQNIIITFQLGQLTQQPKTLDDLDRFGFYHGLACYAEYFTL
jgi:hypothetical protein